MHRINEMEQELDCAGCTSHFLPTHSQGLQRLLCVPDIPFVFYTCTFHLHVRGLYQFQQSENTIVGSLEHILLRKIGTDLEKYHFS